MTEYHDYKSPTGAKIIGTAEMILATASISGISKDGEPEYDGSGSEIHWDSQTTAAPDGKTILFVDENGQEWTFDQLTRIKDEEGDAGIKEVTMLIRSNVERDSETGLLLFWNNEMGWVDQDSATRFTQEESWRFVRIGDSEWIKEERTDGNGTDGQNRESYSDTQDRDSYTVSDEDEED